MQASQNISNRIQELCDDHRILVEYLQANNRLQMLSRVEESFSKTLLIAVASYFEVQLTAIILDLYREMTEGSEALIEFVRKQGIGRRFAQLFQWETNGRPGRNANSFYRLFGPEFANYMKDRVTEDRQLDAGVKAFLEIGNLRNEMVHGDFADFQLNKNVDDIYELYISAILFLDEFPKAIRNVTMNNRMTGI